MFADENFGIYVLTTSGMIYVSCFLVTSFLNSQYYILDFKDK